MLPVGENHTCSGTSTRKSRDHLFPGRQIVHGILSNTFLPHSPSPPGVGCIPRTHSPVLWAGFTSGVWTQSERALQVRTPCHHDSSSCLKWASRVNSTEIAREFVGHTDSWAPPQDSDSKFESVFYQQPQGNSLHVQVWGAVDLTPLFCRWENEDLQRYSYVPQLCPKKGFS